MGNKRSNYRFGSSSREFLKNIPNDPGPGTYKGSEEFGRNSPKFTMNGRSNLGGSTLVVPGPATYSPEKSKDTSYKYSYFPYLILVLDEIKEECKKAKTIQDQVNMI